jgi:hypothetical protein
MNKFNRIIFALISVIAVSLAFWSCTKSATTDSANSNNPTVTGTAGVFQGAGSKWKATFTTTDFVLEYFLTATAPTADMTVNGTYVEYTSGFRLLTVTTATGTNAPTAGSQAYGFNIPGFAFLLKPIGNSDDEIIVMLDGASCPASGGTFNANWIIAKFDNATTLQDTKDVFGTAVFDMSTPASSDATITQFSAQTATNLGTNVMPFDYTTCANGILSFTVPASSPLETVDMFFTANGGALVHSHDTATHDSLIFAAPKHTGDVTQTDLAGTYSVLVFDSDSSGDKVFPAKLTIPTSGDATANRITDVATDALDTNPITIGNFTAKAGTNGIFTAAIDPTGDNGRLNCTHFTLSSKKSIVCNGYGSASGSLLPFFFLARER